MSLGNLAEVKVKRNMPIPELKRFGDVLALWLDEHALTARASAATPAHRSLYVRAVGMDEIGQTATFIGPAQVPVLQRRPTPRHGTLVR